MVWLTGVEMLMHVIAYGDCTDTRLLLSLLLFYYTKSVLCSALEPSALTKT